MLEIEQDWGIARTQAAHTLGLAKALEDAGFRAWTPTEVIVRRARRAIPRKEMTVPLMPGLIFIGWDRLAEIIAMSRNAMSYQHWDAAQKRMVTKGFPFFRMLQVGGIYARVADRDLMGLRSAESHSLVQVKRRTMKCGAAVRLIEGSFEGMRGTVEGVKGTFATVRFAAWPVLVQVALHLLVEDEK